MCWSPPKKGFKICQDLSVSVGPIPELRSFTDRAHARTANHDGRWGHLIMIGVEARHGITGPMSADESCKIHAWSKKAYVSDESPYEI